MTLLENLPWKSPVFPAATSSLVPLLPTLLRENPVYAVPWRGPELGRASSGAPGNSRCRDPSAAGCDFALEITLKMVFSISFPAVAGTIWAKVALALL